MYHNTPHTPRWYTASAGRTANVSPLEQSSLQSHVALCRVLHSRIHGLGSGALTMQGLIATRFATAALVVSLLTAGWLWLY